MYLSAYKKECVFAPLFKMLEALFELFVPLVVSAIIDTGIGNADKGYIVKNELLLVTLAVIGLTCAITAQYFAAKAQSVVRPVCAIIYLSISRAFPLRKWTPSVRQH